MLICPMRFLVTYLACIWIRFQANRTPSLSVQCTRSTSSSYSVAQTDFPTVIVSFLSSFFTSSDVILEVVPAWNCQNILLAVELPALSSNDRRLVKPTITKLKWIEGKAIFPYPSSVNHFRKVPVSWRVLGIPYYYSSPLENSSDATFTALASPVKLSGIYLSEMLLSRVQMSGALEWLCLAFNRGHGSFLTEEPLGNARWTKGLLQDFCLKCARRSLAAKDENILNANGRHKVRHALASLAKQLL